jgi:hypothetical protein
MIVLSDIMKHLFPFCLGLERLCACTDKGSLHFFVLNDENNVEEREEDGISYGSDFCVSVSSHNLSYQQQNSSNGSPLATTSSEAADFTHDPFNTVIAPRSSLSPIGAANTR